MDALTDHRYDPLQLQLIIVRLCPPQGATHMKRSLQFGASGKSVFAPCIRRKRLPSGTEQSN